MTLKIPQSGICPAPCVIQHCARSSSVKSHLPSKVVFRQRSSSIKGRLPSKVVLRQRSSSFKGCLSSKGVFNQRSSFIKGCLPSKAVFRQRSSSIGSRKKVQAEKSSNRQKCRTFFLHFFWVHMEPDVLQRWQTTHLKLFPNNEQWYDKIA